MTFYYKIPDDLNIIRKEKNDVLITFTNDVETHERMYNIHYEEELEAIKIRQLPKLCNALDELLEEYGSIYNEEGYLNEKKEIEE